MRTSVINDRIDIRINSQQKELIKYASDLSGFKSLSEFIVFCINKEANKIVIENSQVLKSIEDKKIFLATILNPPSPNTKLKKAKVKYNKFIEANGNVNTGTGKKS